MVESLHIGSFPLARDERVPFAQPTEYIDARGRAGLVKADLWSGETIWVATRHEDVIAVLTDDRFSVDPNRANFPSPNENRSLLERTEAPAFAQLDPPIHSRIRRMFTPMFTMKRVQQFRERIQSVVDQSLDSMEASGEPGDIVNGFAYPISTTVIAVFMGVPEEDREFFVECANARFLYAGRDVQAPIRAGEALASYLSDLLKRREDAPTGGDDIVSRIVAEQIVPGNLTRDEAVVYLRSILVNGQDTTANIISLSTMVLLTIPDQLELFKANLRDSQFVAGAVDELLRFFPNALFRAPRVAIEDVVIGGQTIVAGDGIVASLEAADHDPSVYPNPEKLDLTRDSSNHLSFSGGIHMCLGRQLATVEIELALAGLFARLPNLRLAVPFDALRFTNNDAQAFGIHELPVTWS